MHERKSIPPLDVLGGVRLKGLLCKAQTDCCLPGNQKNCRKRSRCTDPPCDREEGSKGGGAQPSAQGVMPHSQLWPILSTSQGAVGLLVDVLPSLAPERSRTLGTELCGMCKGNPKGKSTCCKYLRHINAWPQWKAKPR